MTRRKRDQRIERLRAVEYEARTAVVAVGVLSDAVRADPSSLARHGLKPANPKTFRENLQPTYLVRIYAEFESGLREAWSESFGRQTHPKAEHLINSIAARCAIPLNWLRDVHAVRVYRNALLHEQARTPQPMVVAEATQRLVRYFSRLPSDW